MTRILPALLFSLPVIVFAQRSQVIDAITGEPVPFPKVIPAPGTPFLADIDGYFTIPSGAVEVLFRSQGYQDVVYDVSAIGPQVLIHPVAGELEEVQILPGVNPAERIMERAIANRKKNHPMSDETFTYTSYSKFLFTVDPDAIAQIADHTTDSNLIEMRKFFGKQHLFMLENTTQKYFEPPYREKEIITAYKVSGFSDPMFATFASEVQTFNFYENQFNLFGRSYVNPMAFGSIRRYLFILEDSTVTSGDTTFTIRFQPRQGKNFDALKGWLYINSNGYAIEKVIAQPAGEPEIIAPKIIQEYAFIDGKKWFPVKLSTEAVFPGIQLDDSLENSHLIAKGSTYIEHIVLGADLSKERFNAVAVRTAPDAGTKDSTHWDNSRKYGLTDKEIHTYAMIDSMSKKHRIEQKLGVAMSLAEGKVPVGYIQFDLSRLIDYRTYEGCRLGLGIENSKKLMERGLFGGYFGYGMRDKDWKYGGYASWMLFPKQFVELKASFQEDLVKRGGVTYLTAERGLLSSSLYRHLYINNMEHQRKAELSVTGYVTPTMRLLLSGNYQRIGLTKGYEFNNGSGLILNGNRPFDLAEVNAEVVWTFREKVMYIGTRRISTGSLFPRISAKVTRGLSGIEGSLLDYTRLNLEIRQEVAIRAVGKFSYLISVGKTVGDVPLFLMQMPLGTGGRSWKNISVINSFETMLPSSFFNREAVALFTRFAFKPMKTSLKWTKPQFSIHHAMGTGSFDRKEQHTVNVNDASAGFSSMDRGYYEAGLIADKLLVLNNSGFGIGCFYNYGAYASPYVKNNVTLKLSLTFVF